MSVSVSVLRACWFQYRGSQCVQDRLFCFTGKSERLTKSGFKKIVEEMGHSRRVFLPT